MKVIYKYLLSPIHHNAVHEINMPKGAKILDIQNQPDNIVIWAMVNPKHDLKKRVFYIAGTGFELHENIRYYDYLKTIQRLGYVWHIFEVHE